MRSPRAQADVRVRLRKGGGRSRRRRYNCGAHPPEQRTGSNRSNARIPARPNEAGTAACLIRQPCRVSTTGPTRRSRRRPTTQWRYAGGANVRVTFIGHGVHQAHTYAGQPVVNCDHVVRSCCLAKRVGVGPPSGPNTADRVMRGRLFTILLAAPRLGRAHVAASRALGVDAR